MTIKQALAKHRNVEIEILLSHLLGKSKEFLYLHPDHRLNARQITQITQIAKRREKGEPVAYILGYKDFMGHRFKVNRDVLIPRPETEGLVELALKHIPPQSPLVLRGEVSQVPPLRIRGGRGVIRIFDLGTGSGCIIISLAKLLPPSFQKRGLGGVSFYASDISQKALAIARQNARGLLRPLPPSLPRTEWYWGGRGIKGEGKIKFIHSDILQNVRMSFDVIVANLPYVPRKDYESRIKNLKWEPKTALVDSVRDFDIYEKFFKQVRVHINPGGLILLEIDPVSKTKLSFWAKKYLPSATVKFHEDFNGLWRYMEIRFKQ